MTYAGYLEHLWRRLKRLPKADFDAIEVRQDIHSNRIHRRAHGHLQSVIFMENTNGMEDVVVVVERLAHSHEDDAETLSSFSRKQFDLRDDLGNREVASQSQLPGQTKRATQSASNL